MHGLAPGLVMHVEQHRNLTTKIFFACNCPYLFIAVWTATGHHANILSVEARSALVGDVMCCAGQLGGNPGTRIV